MECIDTIPKEKCSLIEVLIIEDELLIGWSLKSKLHGAGFGVTLVDSGEKGIERFRSSKFDIIITDFKLPDLNGLAVASKIKEDRPLIPIIMMSSYGNHPAYTDSPHTCIDKFIEKPFDLDELLNLVRDYTQNLDR